MPSVSELKQKGPPAEAKDCTAVLLAAGVGRRLGGGRAAPKVLLDFGGRSLLRRHMEALEACGVERLAITVGFGARQVIDHVAAVRAQAPDSRLEVSFIENPAFRDGSLVSLHAQSDVLRSGRDIVLMDGDVLYDDRMIRRLLARAGEGVLLVDREIEPGDEPVKVCFDADGRIVDFRKVPERSHAWFGESVGFFRFSPRLAGALADRCAHYVARGLVKTEYEEAIRELILVEPDAFAAEDISNLPWTEIDFPEDVAKAADLVLPQLRTEHVAG